MHHDLQSRCGVTPLIDAAQEGNSKIVEMLLKAYLHHQASRKSK